MECCRDVFILHYPMTVSLVQWCALIGFFNCRISGISTNSRYNLIRKFVSMHENLLLFYHYIEGVYITVVTLLYIFVLLLCHADIKPNSGPKKLNKNPLSVCHWNLNSLSAHNFSKLTHMKAYISMYKARALNIRLQKMVVSKHV